MTTHSHAAIDVANWFLAWSQVKNQKITKLTLQKLLYFSQAHHLAEYGSEIFSDNLEAWENGPVVPLVYASIKGNESAEVELEDDFNFDIFSADENQFFIKIWNTYASLHPYRLVNKTHKEFPWKEFYDSTAYPSNIIPKNVLENYYLLREVAV